MVLSQWFPIFGRYAVLLSVIAGLLELVPIIGPIISAVPAVLLAATASPAAVLAALLLYFLVQQVENNFLVPKIQGNAVQLHPAAVVFAIIIGGRWPGCSGRSWPCRSPLPSATSSATCSAGSARTSRRRSPPR